MDDRALFRGLLHIRTVAAKQSFSRSATRCLIDKMKLKSVNIHLRRPQEISKMSLIPSESYSFPDHFTQTVTYSSNPKRKKSVPSDEPEAPRKKGFFLPLRKSLGRKKRALPSTVIAEELDAESSPLLTTPSVAHENGFDMPVAPSQVSQPETLLPIAEEPQAPSATPEVVAETSIPAPVIERELPRPQKAPVPIARPAAVIRKSPVPPNLKPKPRWNTRAAAPVQPAPPSNNGGSKISPVKPTDQKMFPPRPVQPAPPARMVPSRPADVMQPPPNSVIESPPPDLRQILFAHAGQAPAPPPESATPEPRQDVRSTLRREAPNGTAPRPVMPASVRVNQEFDFETPVEAYPAKGRRRSKFARFIICEGATLAVLLPLAILGFCRVFSDPILVLLINILTIAAAVTAALIPILFFALAPTLPRDESMNSL